MVIVWQSRIEELVLMPLPLQLTTTILSTTKSMFKQTESIWLMETDESDETCTSYVRHTCTAHRTRLQCIWAFGRIKRDSDK